MKESNRGPGIAPEAVALVFGFFIGLGLAVHELFFAPALLFVLIVVGTWTREQVNNRLRDFHRRARHPRSTSTMVIPFCAAFLLLLGCALSRASHSKPEIGKNGESRHQLSSGTFGEVVRGPRGRSEIALTFDAGAEAECFDDLINALESARVHSTFFITGNWAQKNRDCAAAITRHGHEVGNHTWNHLNLIQQSDDIVREEISRAEVILNELTGQSPRPLWRAPYGERDGRVLRIASTLGYRSIYWTLDSLDGVEPVKTPQFLIDRITRKSDEELDGAIVLMHVGERATADALTAIIANLQGRGFRLVTVSKLLEAAPKTP